MAALDDWSSLTCLTREPIRKEWLMNVARRADLAATPWREHARDPETWKSEMAAAEVIETAPVGEPCVTLLLAIQSRWAGMRKDPVPFMKRVQQAHPDHFFVNAMLGQHELKFQRPAEAIGYFRAALAVRPSGAIIRNNLGVALAAVGKADEALIQYQEAIRIDPKASQLDLHSAKALNTLGRLDEAIEQCRLAIGIDPKSTQAHSTLGALLDSKGRVNESIEEYQRTIALDPKLNSSHRDLRIILRLQGRDEEARAVWERATAAISLEHDVFYGYAEFCLFLGREDEYRRARRALLDAFGASTSPFIAERTARACLLLPTSDDELARIVALGERAWSFDPSKYPTSFLHFVFVRGLAEYRQGRLDSAIATMQGQASRVLGPAPRLVLAMALHRSGREVEARKALAQAVLAHDWRPSKVADQDDWIYHSLRREAEAMILPKLSAYLDGSCQPRDNDERLASLGACQFLNRHVASARLDSDAFTADPSLADDLRSGHRLKAACAATLAGSGQGAEAIGPGGESERRRWRLQARQ